jgi:UDP-N-acetylmuramoyl-L-alanyl-D-glutamate--2,6-diaminopimelate ligase
VRLDDLLDGVEVRGRRGGNPEVAAVTHDSRAVQPGTLFCCLPGERFDGHRFAASAVSAGAVALLAERYVEEVPADTAQVLVDSARAAMPLVAAAAFRHPSRSLDVIGVTGTNGKTTTTFLIKAALEADGRPTQVLGTLGGARTTPESPELQAALAGARDEGAKAVAMEVSSHALVQHRVDGVDFAVAAFTNLSQDHLDYHGDMASYFEAKATLFERDRARRAVINDDDEWGVELLRRMVATAVRTWPYTLSDAKHLDVGPEGSTFKWHRRDVRLRLGGRFNVSNALCAATVARALDVPTDAIAHGLSSLESVPGRFERVDAGQPFAVVVDYAHTPDGLTQVLAAAREVAASGRVIVVFGAGGDRDRGKRPLMGAAASSGADLAVLTSDNPRSEDPMAIIEEVRAGAVSAGNVVVEPDRAAAIALAVGEAKPGDVVVIAGKGHETGQTVGETTTPFDDRDVARAAVEARP